MQKEKHELQMVQHDAGHGGPDPDAAWVEFGDGSIRVVHEYDYPGDNGMDVEFEVREREVNQFAHYTSWRNGESSTSYERENKLMFALIWREDGEWFYASPTYGDARQRATHPESELNPDLHLPTQIDGVTQRLVESMSTRRNWYKKFRYKVKREFVERVDTAYALKWKVRRSADRNGSSRSTKECVAERLVTADE